MAWPHATFAPVRYDYVPRQDFNYKGFVGGVPVKHRKIRRVNPAGVSGLLNNGSLEAAVFVLLSQAARGLHPAPPFVVIVQEQDA